MKQLIILDWSGVVICKNVFFPDEHNITFVPLEQQVMSASINLQQQSAEGGTVTSSTTIKIVVRNLQHSAAIWKVVQTPIVSELLFKSQNCMLLLTKFHPMLFYFFVYKYFVYSIQISTYLCYTHLFVTNVTPCELRRCVTICDMGHRRSAWVRYTIVIFTILILFVTNQLTNECSDQQRYTVHG